MYLCLDICVYTLVEYIIPLSYFLNIINNKNNNININNNNTNKKKEFQ